MFDTRSEINKLCTNLYQTPISTNGAKIILKKHGPKQQDSCMQMKKTKPVNLKLWTIRIRCLICKLIMIYRTAENLRHNHPSIGKNMCCEFRLRKQNAGLRDAVVRFVYMVWTILLVCRIAFMILQRRKFRTFMTRDVRYAF